MQMKMMMLTEYFAFGDVTVFRYSFRLNYFIKNRELIAPKNDQV